MKQLKRLVLIFLISSLFFLSINSFASTNLKFEDVFLKGNEPNNIHFKVDLVSNGNHEIEVWRSGQNKIKRITDKQIETYAIKKNNDDDFYLSILDLKRKIHTQINRTNLIRIGNFSDWFDLGHGIKHPLGDYQLTKTQSNPRISTAVEDCQWYELKQGNQFNKICWSTKAHLPFIIASGENQILWKITNWDTRLVEDKFFVIHDEGFIRNNANEDIDHD
jgi:hypothetical protein